MAKADVKKAALFDDSGDDSDGGAKLQINSEYARRFEHNKKREELHRRKPLLRCARRPFSDYLLTIHH
jgi:hypothetical protein